MSVCTKCGQPLENGGKPRRPGDKRCGAARGMCSKCYHKTYHANRTPSQREQHRQRCRARSAEAKAEVYKRLGNACACCGETTEEFLTFDHIQGGGRAHRKKIGSGLWFYQTVLKEGVPKDKYRLLRWNCNCSIGIYGFCPHEEEGKYGNRDT